MLDNRYRIVELLGTGAMGSVYLALDERLSSNVAVKNTIFRRFHLAPEQIAELRRAFEREAKLLANLQHDAIPRVFDYFFEDEEQHLVMEFISGEDLYEQAERKRRKNETFDVPTVIDWSLQLLDALDYLHTQPEPVIHKDIKLSNLKVNQRGRIKLLDFGISKGFAGEMTRVEAGSLQMGTEEYAPLEQFLRFPSKAAETMRHALSIKHKDKVDEILLQNTDARSDLYSLAVTIYRLLTNKPPADYLPRALAVWEGHADPIVPLDEINKNVPVSVSKVLMRALALDKSDRPTSASEMCRELQAAWQEHLRATDNCEELIIIERQREREEIERRLTAQYENHLAAEIARRETAEAALVERELELNQVARRLQEISTTGFQPAQTPVSSVEVTVDALSTTKRQPDSTLAKLLGKKYLGAILLAIIAVSGAAFTWNWSRDATPKPDPAVITEIAREHLERGKMLAARKNYQAAIDEFSLAIKIDSQLIEPVVARGAAYQKSGDFDRAVADYSQVIEREPLNTLAVINRADIYCREKKDVDRAFAEFQRFASLKDSDYLYEIRGYCYETQSKYDEALSDYNRALELDSKEPSTYFRRGVIYLRRSELDKAVQDFSENIRLEPNNGTAYANRAVAYKSLGKTNLARADEQKARELQQQTAN